MCGRNQFKHPRTTRRGPPPRLTLSISLACLALVSFPGCSTYHAKPLDPASIEAALKPTPPAAIEIAAGKLVHPLLAPITLNGRGRGGYTPDEIAVITVIVSPKLRALRDQRGVAAAQTIQAGLLPNPQLGYSLDQQHGNDDPSLVNGTGLALSWEATSLLGYRDRVAASKATGSALDLEIAWQEWQAAQAARLAAYRILSLQGRLPYLRDTEQQLAEARDLARQAQAKGYRTAAEFAATSEAWSAAQDARFALEQELLTQRITLALALGVPVDQELPIQAPAQVPALPTAGLTPANLLVDFEHRRLDLLALNVGYESAEATLRAAVKAQFPKIGLSLGRATDTSNVHTRNFGVTIDLPIFDRGQGQIAIASATRQQLFDEYIARVAESRAEVVQILANLDVTRTQLQTIDAELPELEEISHSLDQAFQSRNADAQAWRDARIAVLSRRLEQSKLRQDLIDLGIALELATGRPLLGQPAL